MNSSYYRQPPLVKFYIGHAIGTALLGLFMPSGEHLEALHRLMLPIVKLIPNALRITNRVSDPEFAQAFIGLSLLIGFLILMYFVVFVRGYKIKVFESKWQRFLMLFYAWIFFGFVMIGISWFMPYLDPVSKGRTYFLVLAATSSTAGILTVMNQLIVGFPLFFFLFLWFAHACSTVRNRSI